MPAGLLPDRPTWWTGVPGSCDLRQRFENGHEWRGGASSATSPRPAPTDPMASKAARRSVHPATRHQFGRRCPALAAERHNAFLLQAKHRSWLITIPHHPSPANTGRETPEPLDPETLPHWSSYAMTHQRKYCSVSAQPATDLCPTSLFSQVANWIVRISASK